MKIATDFSAKLTKFQKVSSRALDMFSKVIDELTTANTELKTVSDNCSVEIKNLEATRIEADKTYCNNLAVIGNVKKLMGQA